MQTTATKKPEAFKVFYHETREDGSVYRRETRVCDEHAERFFQLHPDAYGIGDRGGKCIICK